MCVRERERCIIVYGRCSTLPDLSRAVLLLFGLALNLTNLSWCSILPTALAMLFFSDVVRQALHSSEPHLLYHCGVATARIACPGLSPQRFPDYSTLFCKGLLATSAPCELGCVICSMHFSLRSSTSLSTSPLSQPHLLTLMLCQNCPHHIG